VEFKRSRTLAKILDPRSGHRPVSLPLEVRWDPLTGHSSRLLPGAGLLPAPTFDLRRLAETTRKGCPFCSNRIGRATPKFPPEISPEGRFRRGEAVLFPNLLPYAQYSSVAVYSADLHFIPPGETSPRLVADNLAAQVEFDQAVMRADPDARWASINANYLPPSGSSVFHPHTQGAVNPLPTTLQRLLAEVPGERFRDYLDAERRENVRYLGSTGGVEWLASFAPIAPAEIRAFVLGIASPAELSDDLTQELAFGISTALGLYAELGFNSYNLAVYGAPPGTAGYPLNIRIVRRANVEELYRSDVTWLERLHWEAAVDIMPEELAERAGARFRK
jgi:UDPglucose--hexose-1-phosphate uridylyltransferase